MATIRFFTRNDQPEGEPATWHAYDEAGTASLCGEAQLTYNVDPVADTVPDNGIFHLACREKLGELEAPATPPEEAQPAP